MLEATLKKTTTDALGAWIPTLEEANRLAARWGGYLDRKLDDPPEPESIGIGLRRLYDVTFGWTLASESRDSS